MQIEVNVTGQKIERLNSPGSVEDTLNYLTCHFVFEGEEWDNTVKTAHFQNYATKKIYSALITEGNTCVVPWEALTDQGFVKFSVAGERENYRITTDTESFYNGETVYGGNPSEPPTPDQYDQLIALAQETKEIAESVREDADEGEFDGPPGPAGKDGQNATDEQVRTAVDAYMEEHPIQGDTEDIIKLAIKNEASGAVPIAVTDSADMGVQDLEMQGWTEQDSTEGKNLFDILDFESNNKGIIENGTILFKQSLGTVTYYLNLNPGTYSISVKRSGYSGISIKINEVAVINNGGSNNYTDNFDVSDGDSVVLELSEGQNPNGEDRMVYDIMLNSGSTALPYEPYTGAQPSPNPDYPQEIVSAGNWNKETQKWEYEIEVGGTNLWGFEQSIEFERTVRLAFNRELPAGEYTFSAVVHSTDTDDSQCLLNFLTADGGQMAHYIGRSNGDSRVSAKISISIPVAAISLYASTLNTTSEGDTASFDDIMFNIGDTALPYEPYHLPQTVALTADRPLTKWDKLTKKNGVWGWEYGSAEIVFDGSETWFLTGATSDEYQGFALKSSDYNAMKSNLRLVCDKFAYSTSDKINTCRQEKSEYGLRFVVSIEYVPNKTVADWENWLQSNQITVLYQLAEPTFVPLSETEQEQMNALHTFRPTTVLDNDQGCDMALTYIADTKAYIDNKVSAIQAAIVNAI